MIIPSQGDRIQQVRVRLVFGEAKNRVNGYKMTP